MIEHFEGKILLEDIDIKMRPEIILHYLETCIPIYWKDSLQFRLKIDNIDFEWNEFGKIVRNHISNWMNNSQVDESEEILYCIE